MNAQEVIWSAGFFDGEGCIHLGVSRNTQVRLECNVASTTRAALDFLSGRFGGAVCPLRAKLRRRDTWQWRVTGFNAAVFLRAIRPYSLVKAPEIDLALEFFALPWRRQSVGRGGFVTARTEQQIAVDLEMAVRMRRLKRPA